MLGQRVANCMRPRTDLYQCEPTVVEVGCVVNCSDGG